ncbi:MAG: VC2046/SO_2500 family protein [Pseudomonadota bacterium]
MAEISNHGTLSVHEYFDQQAAAALDSGHGAEFALWLAAMGEQPVADEPAEQINWQRRLGAAQPRPLGYDQPYSSSSGVFGSTSQLTDFKLHDALHPQPLAAQSDPDRLPLELIANLDWQTLRRQKHKQQPQKLPRQRRDPAQLYDVLQQLGIAAESPLM